MNNKMNNMRDNQREAVGAAHSPQSHIKVGITHGDTNGVGYELIFQTFGNPTMFEVCTPIVYGSPQIANAHKKALGLQFNYQIIEDSARAVDGQLNLIDCVKKDVPVNLGQPDKAAGFAAYCALERATADLREGKIDVLVTAPIDKFTIQSDDFHFTGHTEYLQDRLQGEYEPLMILMNGQLRVALVTTHLPLSEVAPAITAERVELKLRLLQRSLRTDFQLPMPRIAVLSLNPHCGDNGTIGNEEADIIKPVIKKLVKEGKHVFGPYPADGFFGSELHHRFDAVLAMYHDQGLAPFKAIAMEEGVNFTAGLSAVRTSPDHGVAYDIAGKGVASVASFRSAVYSAIDIYRNRKADAAAKADPLPLGLYEKRQENERARKVAKNDSTE